jgi:hypothetical protein
LLIKFKSQFNFKFLPAIAATIAAKKEKIIG